MRKAQKQRTEELAKLLRLAYGETGEFIEKNDAMSAMALLENCQNSAIVSGTLIDNT